MQDTKQQIVDAAKALFARKGFSGTGLREIAKNAGISLSNIYNYFKNKNEIFEYIFDPRVFIDKMSHILPILQDNFPYSLNRAIKEATKVIEDDPDLFRLIFIDIIEFNAEHFDRFLSNIIDFYRSFLEESLNLNDAIGTVLRDGDYHFYTRFFIVNLISGVLITNALPSLRKEKKNYSDEELSEIISDVILNGVLLKD